MTFRLYVSHCATASGKGNLCNATQSNSVVLHKCKFSEVENTYSHVWHCCRFSISNPRFSVKRARERSEQHSSEVYSSRTGHLPEAPKCIGPEVNNFVTRQMRICAENQWNLRHPWIETYISSGITSSAEADMCRGSMEFKTPLNRSFQTCRHYKFSRCGYVQRVNGI